MEWGAALGTPLATRGRTVRIRRQAADGQPTIRFMATFTRTQTLDTARRSRDQTLTARSTAVTAIDLESSGAATRTRSMIKPLLPQSRVRHTILG